MEEKIALAACSGMSPNGLVARVAVHDLAIDDVEILSICMGSTSATLATNPFGLIPLHAAKAIFSSIIILPLNNYN